MKSRRQSWVIHEKKSNNTNFAFLTGVELTEPVEDTTAYWKSAVESLEG